MGGGPPRQETLSVCEGVFLHIDRVAIKVTETPSLTVIVTRQPNH